MVFRRGELRSRSVNSSRQSTPNPSQMRDQELADEMYLSRNAYDAHGPYDADFDSPAGPSRPPPIPYDDPYGDDYTAPVAEHSSISSASSFDSKPFSGRSSGSGRGHDRGHHGRGRSRGRGRERGGQRDRGRGESGYRSSQQHMDTPTSFDDSQQSRTTRPLTPTSFAIARATGQVAYNTNTSQHQEQQQQSFSPMYPDALGNGSWGYNHVQSQAQFQPQYGYLQQLQQANMQAPLVQPHINPRFASAFGIAINAMQQLNQIPSTVQQQYSPQNTTTHPSVGATGIPNLATGNNVHSSFHWTDEWKVDHDPAS